MKTIKWMCCAWMALLALVSCSDSTDGGSTTNADVTTLNVDVILPQSIYSKWQPDVEWMQSNLSKAQQGLSKQVKINVRYHEEKEDEIEHLAFELTHPDEGDTDTCSAIIGPYYDSNARKVLNYAVSKRLPVLMPTCSSGELQRINARSTNAWFLTESDITQCEVLLSVLKSKNVNNVALVYANDEYGETFRNWFGFMVTERKMNVVKNGIIRYTAGTNLSERLAQIHNEDEGTYMILALSSQEDYLNVLKQIGNVKDQTGKSFIVPVCTSSADFSQIAKTGILCVGVSAMPAPSSGYASSYSSKFGKEITAGEAQMYDALSLVALGAAKRLYAADPNSQKLTDWMRDVVSYKEGSSTSWEPNGLATAFRSYSQGKECNVGGASGSLLFDESTHTKALQSSYQLWLLQNGEKSSIGYFSTAGSNSTASTTSIWDWEQKIYDDFDPNLKVDRNLPACTDHWAVLLSPSTTWANYRHQADVFAMYQLLKQHGYDDDHIIVIVQDNLADSKENEKFAGQIFVEVGGENVHKDVKVDYHFKDLTPDDLADIMLGKKSDRLPEVLQTTNSSDVLFFWSGHGGDDDGPLWGDESGGTYFGSEKMKNIVQAMHDQGKYRRMMLAIETCYSGIWGNAITGIPDVVAITAANAYEPSKADVQDRTLGVFLSNAFARSFRNAINANPSVSLRDLYLQLAKTTTGSHVSLFNESQYGSVYTMNMSDYMK